MESALNAADPQDKSALLTSLGVTVSYDPTESTARVTCTPRVREKSCRRGDTTVSLTLHSPPSSPSLADTVGGSIGGMPPREDQPSVGGAVRAKPHGDDLSASGYRLAMRRSTRSSWERKGSLQRTVRWAWSLSLRWIQSTV
jgi:hypothetical protein